MADVDPKDKPKTEDEPAPTPEQLVEKAVAAERERLQRQHEEEVAGLKTNSEALIEEKRKAAEGRQEAERRAKDLELKLKAASEGHDGDEFLEAVNKAAGEKFDHLKREWDEANKAKEEEIAELKSTNARVSADAHRAFVASEFVDAALGDQRVWHEGGGPLIFNALADFVHIKEVDGVKVSRFKTAAGTWVAGKGPDGLMTMTEFLALSRAGKQVSGLPRIDWWLIDKSRGADVKEVSTVSAGAKWETMSESQRSQMWADDPAMAREMVNASAARAAAKSMARSEAAA